MSIGAKLTVLLLLPVVISLSTVIAVGFFFYHILLLEIADLISLILVFLLVWERLRESISKKLEYLSVNLFYGLYAELDHGELFNKQDAIEKAKNELQKHGKFIVISLYPKNFINKLNDFLKLHNSFYEKEEQILKIAQEKWGKKPNKWIFMSFLGFGNYADFPTQYPDLYDIAITMSGSNEHSELIKETKPLFEKVIDERKRIFEEFEEFLEQNSLRFQPKPVGAFY